MKVTVASADKANGHAFVFGVVSNKDKRTAPGMKLLLGKEPKAKRLIDNATASLGAGVVQSLPADSKDVACILVGLGDVNDLTKEKLGTYLRNAVSHVKGLGMESISTTLAIDSKMDIDDAVQGLTHGAIIGDLSFDQWHSKPSAKDAKKPKPAVTSVQLIVGDKEAAAARKFAKHESIVSEAVNDARLIANTPANIATPKWMAAEARKRGKKYGFSVSVLGRKQLREQKYGALTGVAQGSDNEEQLITMTYTPAKVTKNTKTLILVGKGVTFDSGGISIKPGHGMWDMKYDKCGACNVIAAMPAIAQLKPNHKVIGITPCVENMPSGGAQRPGDIVTAKDGTTIEILNTDAEGRLILGDAITYARTFKPDWIIEQSTLTGACEYAVGKTYVAAMSKDDKFVESIINSAAKSGDKAWKLPQGEEFDAGNKGTYADIQNISLSVKAGSSIGGAFVAHFAKDTKFCHLDIASKAWVDNQDYFGKGPTGAGTRIVLQRIMDE
jgi:leucyl aminopeptidase